MKLIIILILINCSGCIAMKAAGAMMGGVGQGLTSASNQPKQQNCYSQLNPDRQSVSTYCR